MGHAAPAVFGRRRGCLSLSGWAMVGVSVRAGGRVASIRTHSNGSPRSLACLAGHSTRRAESGRAVLDTDDRLLHMPPERGVDGGAPLGGRRTSRILSTSSKKETSTRRSSPATGRRSRGT